jgi:hypothetical protein
MLTGRAGCVVIAAVRPAVTLQKGRFYSPRQRFRMFVPGALQLTKSVPTFYRGTLVVCLLLARNRSFGFPGAVCNEFCCRSGNICRCEAGLSSCKFLSPGRGLGKPTMKAHKGCMARFRYENVAFLWSELLRVLCECMVLFGAGVHLICYRVN